MPEIRQYGNDIECKFVCPECHVIFNATVGVKGETALREVECPICWNTFMFSFHKKRR